MKHWASIVCAVAFGAAGLIDTGIAAPTAPKRTTFSEIRTRILQAAKALPSRKRFTAWIHTDAASTTPLIYLSLVTGENSGITDIFQQSGGTLQLVGQLPVGGGPVAVDSAQNVYVTEAGDLSTNDGFARNRIFVYSRGATAPKLVLQNSTFNIQAIYVTKDGTVYAAGPPENYQTMDVERWAPGATTGTLLRSDPIQPWYPANIAVDSSGNVIVGVKITHPDSSGVYHGSDCNPVADIVGCLRELPAGSSTWQAYMPFGGPANEINTGPLLGNGEMLIGDNAGFGFFDILVAFPNGSQTPSREISLGSTIDMQSMTFGSDTSTVWGVNSVGADSLGFNIWEVGYPSGSILMTFPIPSSPASLPLYNTIAVSPAYYPN